MNWRSAFAWTGLALIPIGIGIQLTLFEKAVGVHPPKDSVYVADREGTGEGTPDCDLNIDQSTNRIVNLNESFTLTVHVKLKYGQKCESVVVIAAPAFDVKPEERRFALPDKNSKKEQDFTFVLLPKQPGTQMVAVAPQT